MTKKKKKVSDQQVKVQIAKWTAIGAWAIPATGIVEIAEMLIRHFFKDQSSDKGRSPPYCYILNFNMKDEKYYRTLMFKGIILGIVIWAIYGGLNLWLQ